MANATFTLKKRKDWSFALEDEPGKVYTLPALSGLSYEEADRMQKIGQLKDVTEQGPMIKAFILKYAPELEDKGLGDMEYYEIFNAYGMSEGREKMGESAASRRS